MAVKASATITVFNVDDIAGTTRYYKRVASGSSAPSKPAENTDPDSTWETTEPTVDTSKVLYFVDQTLWSNGAKTYSEVSKSSSYEAAKEAYTKAQNAQNTANNAKEYTDGMKTLFELDKKNGTIKLQAGKLLEILSGGKLIVNAENYQLNEDGTVTITGGSIGGFNVDSKSIEKRDSNGNILLRLDAGDTPEIIYASADRKQMGRFGWHAGVGAVAGGLVMSEVDSYGIVNNVTLCEKFLELKNTTQQGNIMLTRYGIGSIVSPYGNGAFKIDGKQISYEGHDHENLKNDSCTVLLIGHFLRPTTDGDVSLGGADYKWNSFYVNNILANSSIKVGGTNVSLAGHTHSNYSETGHTHSKLAGDKDDIILTGAFLRPSETNGTITLGGASYRWKVVYAKTGTINTSDLRQKHSLETDMEKYIAMLDKIEPTSYVLNDDETESRHVGYIAQKVWLAMKESGLEENDFAGFIRDMQDEGAVYTYGLIYSEFIPILHAKIKQQEKRINELEAKLDAILEKLGEQ